MLLRHSLRSRTARELVNCSERVGQAYLQAAFDVLQRAVNGDLDVLSCELCNAFELGAREPRWEVSHCKLYSVKELPLFSGAYISGTCRQGRRLEPLLPR